jgi:membrane protein required for beta-lactamase induction
VIALLMPLILLLTVVASVAFGILATYAVVLGILYSFGRPAQPEPVRPRLVLVPTQTHASGD